MQSLLIHCLIKIINILEFLKKYAAQLLFQLGQGTTSGEDT